MKVTEVIADQVASIGSEGEAAPLVNLSAEDGEELWKIIAGGVQQMNINNLIRFL